ncbi:DnaB-like helicase C-terminal domain-containing protein [Kitasatospora sp. NPDC086791]|uniref:DnaB-like helicase C-terminal domain-containing protein n=1 Tax=Kitasatospora sp. NPDC086791 TaxID=3155178 RepID=UPI003435E800
MIDANHRHLQAAARAIGVEDARKDIYALLVKAQAGEPTIIRVDDHFARLAPVDPEADLSALPHINATSARAKLGALVAEVAPGSPVYVITRNRQPAALLVAADSPSRPTTRRVLTTAGQTAAEILSDAADKPSGRLRVGIAGVDAAAELLRPGRLTLVVGAPGTGTSLLVLSAAASVALDTGAPVYYAASGPLRTDITTRLLAARSAVDYPRLRAGNLTDDERRAVAAVQEQLAQAPLHIDDGDGLDAAAVAEVIPAVENLALVVVDRLQTEPSPRLPLSGPAVPHAVQDLAHLAHQHQVPILAALDSADHQAARRMGADIVVTLTRTDDLVELTATEVDLDLPIAVPLRLEAVHARLVDRPVAAAAAAAPAPASPAVATVSDVVALPAVRVAAEPPVPAQPDVTAAAPAVEKPEPVTTAASKKLSTGRGKDAIVNDLLGMIARRREEELERSGGDIAQAIAGLDKKAIPDFMELFRVSRVEARYEHTAHPPLLEIFQRQQRGTADLIWEGRPHWENHDLMYGAGPEQVVTRLDMNGAYLSALKCHLPIGQLKHDTSGDCDTAKMGGAVLITPTEWLHPHLPNPMGNREESGKVWITSTTLRLLRRLAAKGLCQAPRVHEAWIAHTSEHMLEYVRIALTLARQQAIDEGDDITFEYVKAMYSKFVSTAGLSNANNQITNPAWQHNLRSQAFFNLYLKALKADQEGLQLVAMKGTDELHVIGPWRDVFAEGRGVTQVKVKEEYTIPQVMKTRRGGR